MRSAYAILLVSLSACGRGGLVHGAADGGVGGHLQGTDTSGSGDTRPSRPSCTFKSFADPVPYKPSDAPYSLRVADVTGDGHLDILVAERSNGVPSLELFTNTGKGGFSQTVLTIAIQPNSGNLVTGDFNGDRIIDLASQSNGASGTDLGTDDGVLEFDFGTAPGKFASQPAPKRIGATRKGWSEGSESCDEFMKFGTSSSGCETRPAKGETAPTGSEPCDGRGNATGDA